MVDWSYCRESFTSGFVAIEKNSSVKPKFVAVFIFTSSFETYYDLIRSCYATYWGSTSSVYKVSYQISIKFTLFKYITSQICENDSIIEVKIDIHV